MKQRTSPRIFELIKDKILKPRDKGQVLHTFKELRELLWQRLSDEPRFTDFQANGLPQASPWQVRNERRPGFAINRMRKP